MELENQGSFWGLVLEHGKQYKQTPPENFHLSRATLDLKSLKNENEVVSVYVQVNDNDFLLCNLSKKETSQAHFDYIFNVGEKIKFYTAGEGKVHLTGYIMPDEMPDDLSEFEDEDLSIDDETEIEEKLGAKRKNTETLKLTGKEAKKIKN